MTPGMGIADPRRVGRVDRREAAAVPVQDEAAEQRVGLAAGPRPPGRRAGRPHERRRPPVQEHVARPEPEAAPLAGALEQRREAARAPRRTLRPGRLEQRVHARPAGTIVPLDDQPSRSAPAMRWRVLLVRPAPDRGVVRARPTGEADPMTGWLDLRDGVEAACRSRGPYAASLAGTSASVATTATPASTSQFSQRGSRSAAASPPSVGSAIDRAARDVRAGSTDDGERPQQDERRVVLVDQHEERPPTEARRCSAQTVDW